MFYRLRIIWRSLRKTHHNFMTKEVNTDINLNKLRASQEVPVVKNPTANAGDVRDSDSIPGL